MCGGYTITKNIERIKERFHVGFDGRFLPPPQARPSQMLPIVTSENPGQITLAHWGLKPFWLEKMGLKKELINTRLESLTKPAFRRDLESRRCLVIADGFLEWTGERGRKTAYHIGTQDFDLFAMAGLYEIDPEGLTRFSIITRSANPVVAKIHDRMPVILTPETEVNWLSAQPVNVDQYVALLGSDRHNRPSLLLHPWSAL
jgi:putative SOS response-associated peptidase YedK